ncbi:RidA family protein [Halorubrum salinum]|uniref:RidA family protein n=1 Tax=Halorubrum salinum TaxID=767517 RepID=UPI002111E570|nr:RidA family protein [Halorubrum salinum]
MSKTHTRRETDRRSAVNPYTRRERRLVFFDGQTADAETIANGGVREQTLAALERIRAVAEEQRIDTRDLVRTTVYLTDMSRAEAVDATFESFFEERRPSRTTVGADTLPDGAAVVIEATGVDG